MTTIKTKEVVIDALENLIVQADEQELPQSEAAAAIRALNDMMLSWEAIGISLGYTVVSSMADLVTVSLGAIAGIKANLSLWLAPKYNVEPTALMIKNAADGYRAIVDLACNMSPMVYPPTLPQGSGNSEGDSTFYPDQSDTVLTESGGSVGLEESTES